MLLNKFLNATLIPLCAVADSDLGLKGGTCFFLCMYTCRLFLPSAFIFLNQNNGGGGAGPSPRSAIDVNQLHLDRKSLHNSFAVIYRNDFSNHPCLNRQYASIVDNTYYHGQTQGLCSSESSCMCSLPISHFLGYHAILSPWNGEKCVA